MIGRTISHYKILEKLGEGGMGVVYKAQDTKLDRIVALKFLPKHLLRNGEAKARFVHEAKAASALDHPNIATIHEIDEAEGECFISMAYIEGKSIKELIKEKELSIEEILKISIQMAEGLSKAHQKGIVHRDIKSDNVMITSDGLVKIMDFGMAKLKGVSRVTKAGTTLGTVSYMSPEQARGEGVDHRTDVWSLGVVLYEMLTGQLPFKGDYEQAVIYSILNEEPKPTVNHRTDVPTELKQIVNRALAKGTDSRYQNAEDILIDLRKLKKNLELMASREELSVKKTQPSIAVLPFRDMSAQKDQEYFCEGMAEEIINALTHVESLRVVARTSAFSFRGKEMDIREIGQKLNVQTVLEGSVRKSGDQLRITAQLINVDDGYHFWSEKYDRDMEDIFAIQDEISLAIVDKLKVKLLGEEKTDLMKHHTENKEAYTNYLKGLYFWNRRSEVGFDRALEYFQKAIAIDPLYALPYVGIADTFNIMGHFCFLPPSEAFGKARAAAKKALEIDDTLGEAHTSMAWINTYNDWDWLSAENEYKRAIGLNPNYATAHEWFAIFLFGMGHFDEAITEGKKVLDLDPLSVMINAVVGLTLYISRRYDEAIEQFQKALEIDPNFPFAYIWQGLAYWEKSMNDEALASLQRAETLAKDMTYCLGILGMAYALAEQKNEAMKVLEKLDKLSEKKYVSPMYKAFIYIGLGKKDKVFEYFEKAHLEREPYLFYIKTAPMFDSLRSDPRFSELLRKIGLEK